MSRMFRRCWPAVCVLVLAGGAAYAVFAIEVHESVDRAAILGRAETAFVRGDHDEAREAFAVLVERDADDVAGAMGLLRVRARVATSDRRRERVYLAAESLERRFPERVDVQRLLVDLALDLGRFDDALVRLRRIPPGADDERVVRLKAFCLDGLGRDAEAINVLEVATRAFPEAVPVYRHRAELLAGSLRFDEAEEVLRELEVALPGDPETMHARIEFERRYGDVSRAVPWSERLCKVTDDDGRDVRLLVTVLREAGEFEVRRQAYREAVALRLRVGELLDRVGAREIEDRGLVLSVAGGEWTRGDRALAMRRLLRSQNRDSNDDVAAVLVEMCVDEGNAVGARRWVSRVESGVLRSYLDGRVEMAGERWGPAIETLTAARRGASGDRGLVERIELAAAECHARRGEIEACGAALRRVLRVSPRSISARLGLAAVAEATGDDAGAMAEYRSLRPEGRAVSWLTELLAERNGRVPEIARHWDDVEELVALAERGATSPGEAARLRELYEAAKRGDSSSISRRRSGEMLDAWRPRSVERSIGIALERLAELENRPEVLRLGERATMR